MCGEPHLIADTNKQNYGSRAALCNLIQSECMQALVCVDDMTHGTIMKGISLFTAPEKFSSLLNSLVVSLYLDIHIFG